MMNVKSVKCIEGQEGFGLGRETKTNKHTNKETQAGWKDRYTKKGEKGNKGIIIGSV